MRGAFVSALCEIAEHDPRVVLLTGDLGYTVVEPFVAAFPDRFFNVGVAEQNMIGIATGLAEAGFIPFAYSIATFASLRAYEFIRNGPILHKFPVRIVGVGGGFEYGSAGVTHYGVEDISVMRAQPGIMVVAPADHAQTRTAVHAMYGDPRPAYIRIGKDDSYRVPGLDGRFELGRANVVREGSDVAFVSLGAVTRQALQAADLLAEEGVQAAVCVVSSFNPSPVDDLRSLLARVPLALSVEAQYVNGGLGSLMCEIAAEETIPSRIVRCGVVDPLPDRSGSEPYLLHEHGLSGRSLAETALRNLVAAR